MPSKSTRQYAQPRVQRREASLQAELNRLRQAERLQPVKPSRPFETRYTKNHDEHIFSSVGYGPFSRTTDIRFAGDPATRKVYGTANWYRSKVKARVAPLPYNMYLSSVLAITPGYQNIWGWSAADAPNSWSGYNASNGIATYDALALNAARSRFVGEVRDKNAASLAVTLAEWGQSQKMIVTRAAQLLEALNAARRLDPWGVASALGVPAKYYPFRGVRGKRRGRDVVRQRTLDEERRYRQRRDGPKAVANLWLEYHFGWEPLVQDIYQAVQVLSSNPPPIRVKATGKYSAQVAGDYHNRNRVYTARALVSANVFVSNPNLALANQLGIINPATVAWELVPFSFVVDWFIPVGRLLDSWTDLLGYGFQYAFYTVTRKTSDTRMNDDPKRGNLGSATFQAVNVARTLGIPSMRLVRPPFKGFSVARGATAIALVIQQFLSIEKRG